MIKNLYLLQATSFVRITQLRTEAERYNLKNQNNSSIEIVPSLYLGLYYRIILSGELDLVALAENKSMNYLFNLKNKNQPYSFQKLTEKEKEKVLSGIITQTKINWKEGDTIIFPLGETESEGVVLEVIDDQWLIVSFSTGGKNKIKVESIKCKKK